MIVPGPIRERVEAALGEVAVAPVRLVGAHPVGGGCISPTARVETDRGASFFLKWGSPDLPAGLLEAEARGLTAIRTAQAVRVPEVIAVGGSGASAWLLLEWLEPGAPSSGAWSGLGASLAALHRHRAPRFGADRDNFIGSLPQSNAATDEWATFWRDRRLAPQVQRARDAGRLDRRDVRRFDALFRRLEDRLAPAGAEGASLLHGDLWSGNVHITRDGPAALIDPSTYHGHREVDLAMAELFGGFGAGFREGYEESWPLAPGYDPVRRAVYQLYYLLVHVNLFGGAYLARTRQALRAAGAD